MKRRFNITGSCIRQRHYVVKFDEWLKRIKEDYIEERSYFVINRRRQYAKIGYFRKGINKSDSGRSIKGFNLFQKSRRKNHKEYVF